MALRLVVTLLLCLTAASRASNADDANAGVHSPTELVSKAMALLQGNIKKRANKRKLFAMVSRNYFGSQGISERAQRKLKANYFNNPMGFEIAEAVGPFVDVKLKGSRCDTEQICTIVRFRVGLEDGNFVLVPGKGVGDSEYVSVWEIKFFNSFIDLSATQREEVIEIITANESGQWPWDLGRSEPPRVAPIDQATVVDDAVTARIAAGETMPERVEDPGFAVASCKSTHLPASGWLNDGFAGYVCENTNAGQAIVRWRAWYCENDRRCVLGTWHDGRYPANTEPLEYTIRSNLGSVAGLAGRALFEFRPPTWKARPQLLPAPDKSDGDSYQAALDLLKAERYQLAALAFEQFLVVFPDSERADSAHYWLAETHYVTKQYGDALRQFQNVIGDYPDSRKVPDALLKMGYCNYELQRWDDARGALARVTADFPETTAARLADRRLQRMNGEGF